MICAQCQGCRWVCEAQIYRPWLGEHACGCGAPGEPCPRCNKVKDGEYPALPAGFVADTVKKR
jgi:hypothetical protein